MLVWLASYPRSGNHLLRTLLKRCFDLGSFASAGRGRIESVAVVTQAVHPLLAERVPYAIVLVSLADAPGILIAGNVVGKEPDAIEIGDPVRAVFEEARDPSTGEELKIPQWEVVSG